MLSEVQGHLFRVWFYSTFSLMIWMMEENVCLLYLQIGKYPVTKLLV